MFIAVVVPFLDEAAYLGVLLRSIAGQTRRPDRLILVDDGSTDGSHELAAAFAREHAFATVLRRPPRPPERDRLASAGALLAFEWGVRQIGERWDVVGKLDADIQLTPETIATLEQALVADPSLGMAGAHLAEPGEEGVAVRMTASESHVHGAVTFYRRACFEQIMPLPPIVGWDMIDAARARMHRWRTASFAVPTGDPLHLRPMGTRDGLLRAYRRWGMAAYALGEHPLHVLLYGVVRMRERPTVLGGATYLGGYLFGAAHRIPRAEPELRAHVRRDELRRIARRLRRGARRVPRWPSASARALD